MPALRCRECSELGGSFAPRGEVGAISGMPRGGERFWRAALDAACAAGRYPGAWHGFLPAALFLSGPCRGHLRCYLAGSMRPIIRCRLATPVTSAVMSPMPSTDPRNVPPISRYAFILRSTFSMIALSEPME